MEATLSTRKSQIFSVAKNLFRERGYVATSMRDLAKEIGIEPASLYSHISSKGEILSSVCFGLADKFFLALQAINPSITKADEKLKAMIDGHVKVIAGELDAAAVFLHEWRFLSEPGLSNFKQQRHNYENEFRNIIQNGIDDGIFRDADVKFLTLSIFSSMNWIYDWYDPSGKMTIEEISEELSNLILSGIKK